MKRAAKGKILPLFWLLVAVFQLFFAAQPAPAKSAFVPENRTWEIFPLAVQSHQFGQLQVSEPQRERAPAGVKSASDDVLGPESVAASTGSNIALDSNGNQLLLPGNPPLMSSNTSTQTPGVIYVTPKGVGVSSDVLSLQGTSPYVGDFTGLNGASVEEIISRIPSSWANAPQRMGQGLVWFDDTGNEAIRIHGPGINAPFGSNSASGWVLRIHAPNGQYYDESGNIVSPQSNDGHIPMGNPNGTK